MIKALEYEKRFDWMTVVTILIGLWFVNSNFNEKIEQTNNKIDVKTEHTNNKIDVKTEEVRREMIEIDRRLCRIEGAMSTSVCIQRHHSKNEDTKTL